MEVDLIEDITKHTPDTTFQPHFKQFDQRKPEGHYTNAWYSLVSRIFFLNIQAVDTKTLHAPTIMF